MSGFSSASNLQLNWNQTRCLICICCPQRRVKIVIAVNRGMTNAKVHERFKPLLFSRATFVIECLALSMQLLCKQSSLHYTTRPCNKNMKRWGSYEHSNSKTFLLSSLIAWEWLDEKFLFGCRRLFFRTAARTIKSHLNIVNIWILMSFLSWFSQTHTSQTLAWGRATLCYSSPTLVCCRENNAQTHFFSFLFVCRTLDGLTGEEGEARTWWQRQQSEENFIYGLIWGSREAVFYRHLVTVYFLLSC